eukprot:1628367-Amphidinium_carterae.1
MMKHVNGVMGLTWQTIITNGVMRKSDIFQTMCFVSSSTSCCPWKPGANSERHQIEKIKCGRAFLESSWWHVVSLES